MKYAVLTFGCRVNQADSLELEERLRDRGAESAPLEAADLVFVNTCSVTATADQGARQTIRRIARDNPAARIVVTGCYATRRPAEVLSLPGVVRVVPNGEKERLVPIVWSEFGLSTATRFGDGEGPCGATLEPGVAGRTAYTLRVQTGCEERCSYCIIPSTRGRSRSRTVEDVQADVHRAAAAGFKEIALTGVHLGSYGRDLTPATTLLGLLQALGDDRSDVTDVIDVGFRVSSLEPMDCTPEIVELMAANRRFAPHFHLPLQHASDRMLLAMRRPYQLAEYGRLVDTIRSRIPHAAIGSDVIVGFPGETDGDLEDNLAYFSGSPLTHLHVFPYSDRPGTAAAALTPKVPGETIRLRARQIRAIGQDLTGRFHRSQLGTVRPGLTLEDGSLVMTDNYLKVRIPPGRRRNERVMVRILTAGETMTGEIVGSRF